MENHVEHKIEVRNAKGEVIGYFTREPENQYFAVRYGDGQTKMAAMEFSAINFILGK